MQLFHGKTYQMEQSGPTVIGCGLDKLFQESFTTFAYFAEYSDGFLRGPMSD